MTRRIFGLVLIVLGGIFVVVSLSADFLGLGARAGIGWKQLTGAGTGILLLGGGIWLRFVSLQRRIP